MLRIAVDGREPTDVTQASADRNITLVDYLSMGESRDVPQVLPRLPSLDGLRGLAALTVVIFHSAMVNPDFALLERDHDGPGGWLSIVLQSPVNVLWAGGQAALVFFVLSGLVMTVPFLHRPFAPARYYPARLIRIYVPVWGATLLALAWYFLVPRSVQPDGSWWTNGHAVDLSVRAIGGDATLVIGTGWINSVLWSLRWEMWFSLLLPLYLWALVRHPRWSIPKLVVLLALIQLGNELEIDHLRYLPLFGVGMILALHLSQIIRWCDEHPRATNAIAITGVLVLLESRWLTGQVVSAASAVGAVVVVAAFAVWRPAVTLGTLRPVRWLGMIAFSLYLVHDPVLTSVAMGLPTDNSLVVLIIGLPVSLAIAVVFYRVVERPSHRLARSLSGWASARAIRRPPQSSPSPSVDSPPTMV